MYALSNYDPFSGAFVLSRGIVGSTGDTLKVASPLYKQTFDLASGQTSEEALDDGARSFVADIESPSAHQATPAYETFGRLSFTRPYLRTHWTRL